MTTTQEKIAVMTAHLEGKPIEAKHELMLDWKPDENPSWDWANYDYRVRPEPMEIWVVEYLMPGNDPITHYFKVRGDAEQAYADALSSATTTITHYREVTE